MITFNGFTDYSEDLGIFRLDPRCLWIFKDICKANTLSFAVRYLTVKGVILSRIRWKLDLRLLKLKKRVLR